MFLLSLVRDRSDVPASKERLTRTTTPMPAFRQETVQRAAAVHEKSNRRPGWFAGIEQMFAAYAELVFRDMR